MNSSTKNETLDGKKVKKKLSKEQMLLAIIKKKQCDATAIRIVEQLLEPNIDSQWLLHNLKYINKSHMEDVIEERAIIKLCGYVLCNNTLTRIINQQYHISTRKNKVYDVTKRKNFCSSGCYGACNYLLEQMLTSPLWLRDKEEIPEFKILSAKNKLEKSSVGDEIHVRDINTVLNLEKNSEHLENEVTTCMDPKNMHSEVKVCDVIENSQTNNAIEESNVIEEQSLKIFDKENEDLESSSINLDNKDNTVLDKAAIQDGVTSSNKNTSEDIKNKEENVILESVAKDNMIIVNKDSIKKVERTKHKRRTQKDVIEKESKEFYNLAIHIEHSVREWVTKDTICLLLGDEDVKNRLLGNTIQHDRYLHLCKKLNTLELEDKNVDLTEVVLKPLPQFSVLQEEGKKIELKVRAFFKGSTIIENRENPIETATEQKDFNPVLPLTDAHAPKTLRRRIFLDKLSKILPDLLRALASNNYSYNKEKSTLIKVLVNTFSLSAGNITFKTAEWTLVGLIIIKMLSMIDPELKILLSTVQASMYISMILMSYKLDSNYLDRFVMELINDIEISNTDNVNSMD